MKKEVYTPMERILIEGAKIHEDFIKALELDAMLLEMEEKMGLMDGFPLEQEAANEQQ